MIWVTTWSGSWDHKTVPSQWWRSAWVMRFPLGEALRFEGSRCSCILCYGLRFLSSRILLQFQSDIDGFLPVGQNRGLFGAGCRRDRPCDSALNPVLRDVAGLRLSVFESIGWSGTGAGKKMLQKGSENLITVFNIGSVCDQSLEVDSVFGFLYFILL